MLSVFNDAQYSKWVVCCPYRCPDQTDFQSTNVAPPIVLEACHFITRDLVLTYFVDKWSLVYMSLGQQQEVPVTTGHASNCKVGERKEKPSKKNRPSTG